MNNKFKAFAILPIAASLTFFGLQVVTSSVAATTSGSESVPATTGATAATIEDCDWYLNGVSENLDLINESGLEYVGDDYTLSTEDDGIEVYFSGTSTPNERCSFYDDVKGVDVEVSWATTAFTADIDSSLDWTLGDGLEVEGISTLDVTYDPVMDSCDVAFEAGASVSIGGAETSPIAPASITNESVESFDPSEVMTPDFARCDLVASYTVVLPGGRTPDSPGSSYSFTGPTLTTTITVKE